MPSLKKSYEILGLKPGASPQEVKEAYRDLVKVWHPDRFQHDAALKVKAEEMLKQINLAHDVIRGLAEADKESEPLPPRAAHVPVPEPRKVVIKIKPEVSRGINWRPWTPAFVLMGIAAVLIFVMRLPPPEQGPGHRPPPLVQMLRQTAWRFWAALTGRHEGPQPSPKRPRHFRPAYFEKKW